MEKHPFPSLPTADWQHQATAFLVRCRAQMWGKHKEDPLTWLYRAGFSVSFAQDHFFGWNFRPMQRNAALWLGPDREGEKYLLPQGLLLPWIQEQQIHRLSILQMEGEIVALEGSSPAPLAAGEGPNLILCENDGDAFRLKQEIQPGTVIMTTPDLSRLQPETYKDFCRIRLAAAPSEPAYQLLSRLREEGHMVEAFWLPAKGLVASLLSGELSMKDAEHITRF